MCLKKAMISHFQFVYKGVLC